MVDGEGDNGDKPLVAHHMGTRCVGEKQMHISKQLVVGL